jgi:hypothetical protein
METTWIRLELVKASLTGVDEKKVQHPIALKIYGVKLGVERTLGAETYEQPMPNPRMVQLDLREQNRSVQQAYAMLDYGGGNGRSKTHKGTTTSRSRGPRPWRCTRMRALSALCSRW